jgi:hypothetical protein
MFQQKLQVLSRNKGDNDRSTSVLDFEITKNNCETKFMFGTFLGGGKKIKPFLYQKGIPARIELSFVKQAPVVMQLGCKFHGHIHIEIFMAHPTKKKSKTNIKKEVPVWRQGQNDFFDLVVYPQSCEAQIKNMPDLRSRSTSALIQNEP